MLARGYRILVHIFVKNNVRLGAQRIWYLRPEEGNGATNLDEGAEHRLCSIEAFLTMTVHNLLNLDPVCDLSLMVDASAQEASASKMTRATRNDHDRELGPMVNEVLLVDVAANNRHDPLLALDHLIEVSHQKVVPHHGVVPRLELLHLLLRLTSRSNEFRAFTLASRARVARCISIEVTRVNVRYLRQHRLVLVLLISIFSDHALL